MKCREACAAPTVTKKPKLMTSQKNDISENHSDPKGTVSFGQVQYNKTNFKAGFVWYCVINIPISFNLGSGSLGITKQMM